MDDINERVKQAERRLKSDKSVKQAIEKLKKRGVSTEKCDEFLCELPLLIREYSDNYSNLPAIVASGAQIADEATKLVELIKKTPYWCDHLVINDPKILQYITGFKDKEHRQRWTTTDKDKVPEIPVCNLLYALIEMLRFDPADEEIIEHNASIGGRKDPIKQKTIDEIEENIDDLGFISNWGKTIEVPQIKEKHYVIVQIKKRINNLIKEPINTVTHKSPVGWGLSQRFQSTNPTEIKQINSIIRPLAGAILNERITTQYISNLFNKERDGEVRRSYHK